MLALPTGSLKTMVLIFHPPRRILGNMCSDFLSKKYSPPYTPIKIAPPPTFRLRLLVLTEPFLIETCYCHHLPCTSSVPEARPRTPVSGVLPFADFMLIISMTDPDDVQLWQGPI